MADDEPFRMTVTACFTITGRGPVVAGEILAGVVRRGDVLDLVHAGSAVRVRCAGVDIGDRADRTFFIALWLPGVRQFDVQPGDEVRAARRLG